MSMGGPIVAIACMILAIAVGVMQQKKAREGSTTFTGSDIAPEHKLVGGKKKSGKKRRPSDWTAAMWERAKGKAKQGWVAFLIAFALAHFLFWYYFPTQYAFIFGNPAIWMLQALVIIWMMVKSEVERHTGVATLAMISITIVALASVIRLYSKWDEKDCKVRKPGCNKEMARARTDSIAKDSIAKAKVTDSLRTIESMNAVSLPYPRSGMDTAMITVPIGTDSTEAIHYVTPAGCDVTVRKHDQARWVTIITPDERIEDTPGAFIRTNYRMAGLRMWAHGASTIVDIIVRVEDSNMCRSEVEDSGSSKTTDTTHARPDSSLQRLPRLHLPIRKAATRYW